MSTRTTEETGASGPPVTDRADPHETPPGERWWPSTGGTVARIIVLSLILAAVLAIPFGIPVVFQNVVARAAVFAIVAFSMNVLMGYAGQVSLGHNAFVGVGAFAAGYIITELEMPYIIALVAAAATGAVAAVILGGVALRVQGLYLALVTIAYALFAQETLFNIRGLTGGGAGMPVPRPGFAAGTISFIYLCYGVLAVVWLIDWRLTSSKGGRAIQALRDDERVAASWGINVTAYKLLAFVISGIIAGFAGALFASIEEIAVSVTFSFNLALVFVLMTFVGGINSRPGIVQGGIVFATLPTLLEQAHDVWGDCATPWVGGFVQQVGWFPAPGPRLVQLLFGLGLTLGGVALLAHWVRGGRRSFWGHTGRAVGTVVLLGLGVLLLVGAVVPGVACMWSPITSTAEPLIGAMLLILTLIFFPGGIAQQQEDLIRWLSFKPFHAPDHVSVTGGTPGGGSTARP